MRQNYEQNWWQTKREKKANRCLQETWSYTLCLWSLLSFTSILLFLSFSTWATYTLLNNINPHPELANYITLLSSSYYSSSSSSLSWLVQSWLNHWAGSGGLCFLCSIFNGFSSLRPTADWHNTALIGAHFGHLLLVAEWSLHAGGHWQGHVFLGYRVALRPCVATHCWRHQETYQQNVQHLNTNNVDNLDSKQTPVKPWRTEHPRFINFIKLQWENNRTKLTKLVAFHCYCIFCLITSQSSRLPSPWASCHPPWRWHRRSGAPQEWIVPPRLMLCRWPQQRSKIHMGTSAKP